MKNSVQTADLPATAETEEGERELRAVEKAGRHWSKSIKKTIYTLNVGNYAPEICALTYPLIQAYGRKIGAEFHVIQERRFPHWPVVYEKLQIYDLAKAHGNDWNIYIDSDTLVNPEMFDVTEHLQKDTVCHNGRDMAGVRWKYDQYFRRDGRHIGSCNWFTVASDWCLDLWRPLDDLTFAEALENISITIGERNSGLCKTEHLIDDYTLSRNIARFGLKVQTVQDICGRLGFRAANGQPMSPFLHHKYTISNEQKVREMLAILSTPNGQLGPVGVGWGILTPDGVAGYRKKWGEQLTRTQTEPHHGPNGSGGSKPSSLGSHIQGWMTNEELEWLHQTAKSMESVVEIGSWKGRSTFALSSSGCPQVYAVDHFEGSSEHQKEYPFDQGWSPFPDFQSNILDHFKNVTLKRMSSADAAKDFADGSVDMVFIDGAHEYDIVVQDLALWAPKARRIVSGHDGEYDSVRRAFGEYFRREPDQTVNRIWAFLV